jgi:cytochrome P450
VALLELLQDASESLANDGDGRREGPAAGLFDAVRARLMSVPDEVDAFAAGLVSSGLAHPRPILALLRDVQPVVVVQKYALVTRYDDVQEVLAQDAAFDVPYAEKMELITNGQNFFLGMRDTPRYTRDASNMRVAVRREDIASFIGPFVDRTSAGIVAEAGGALDIVQHLTQVVPARLVGAYFGTPGPSERELIAWTSVLFQFLFLDPKNDPALRARAVTASAALNGSIDATIASRKAAPRRVDDVLDRCLAMQSAGAPGMTDLDIRNDFIGLIIGAIPTTATATALVVDELLGRPEVLAAARAAALAGDDDRLGGYVFEALRFNPMTPGIFRTANQDYVVAKGTSRAATIPAGTAVVAATQSAMFDPRRVDDAETFRADRPAYAYMHWGHGLHACFGRYINAVQIPKIVKALLLRNAQRAPGDAGQLVKEGPYAASLSVVLS